MSGDQIDPAAAVDALDDDPLGGTDPTWRNEATAAQDGTTEDETADADAWDDAADDAERTIDADPAWLAELAAESPDQVADSDDAERTIDADADLIEHVRAAARAARTGLAAPPTSPGERPVEAVEPAEPAATEPPPATGIDPALPPAPAGVASDLTAPPAEGPGGLPPPTPDTPTWAAVAAATANSAAGTTATTAATTSITPATTSITAAATDPAAAASTDATAPTGAGGRWQPPARLRPAEVRVAAPLIADRAPKRPHLDWRWAAVGVVAAAVIGFLIAIAVSDDAPDPAPGSTTVPGASTTVSTP